MHLPANYHFQVRRDIPQLFNKNILVTNGKINVGSIVQQVNDKLDDLVVFPNVSQYFTLVGVQCVTGNSYGYHNWNIKIPAAYLMFHFLVSNNDIDNLSNPTKIHSRLIRYKTIKSDLEFSTSETAKVYSIGLSVTDLGSNYYHFKNRMSELKLLYTVVGANSKSHVSLKHTEMNDIELMKKYLNKNPRYVLANYDPKYWFYNKQIWVDYPNMITKLDEFSALYYLMFVHPSIKSTPRTSINKLSQEQRDALGINLSVRDTESLIDIQTDKESVELVTSQSEIALKKTKSVVAINKIQSKEKKIISNLNQKQLDSVDRLRTKYEDFIANHPNRKSMSLPKKERKAMGLPPNAFNEQEWLYTMDPNLGRPTPEVTLDLQKTLDKQLKEAKEIQVILA